MTIRENQRIFVLNEILLQRQRFQQHLSYIYNNYILYINKIKYNDHFLRKALPCLVYTDHYSRSGAGSRVFEQNLLQQFPERGLVAGQERCLPHPSLCPQVSGKGGEVGASTSLCRFHRAHLQGHPPASFRGPWAGDLIPPGKWVGSPRCCSRVSVGPPVTLLPMCHLSAPAPLAVL